MSEFFKKHGENIAVYGFGIVMLIAVVMLCVILGC